MINLTIFLANTFLSSRVFELLLHSVTLQFEETFLKRAFVNFYFRPPHSSTMWYL